MNPPAPHHGRAWPARAAALTVDALLWLLLGVILLVIATGGGQLHAGAVRVSVRSVGNPSALVAVLLLVRGWALRHLPVLGLGGRAPADLADAALVALSGARRRADALDRRTVAWLLAAVIVGATAIRLANAIFYFGFITGDDVEIHEMSLGRALGHAWSVWDLRSAFYPMGFIYPAQRLLIASGVTDVFLLVLAGRSVVIAFGALNIVLAYRVGTALFSHRGLGLLAALIFASNHLHMAFGSAELPRVVATSFILAAFFALLRRTTARAGVAGVLLGIGAALRFGEIVFLAPAIITALGSSQPSERGGLDWRNRLAAAAVLATACGATLLAIVAVSDRLYWGEPFHSLRAIVDYTLVQRLSSRGYEPPWHYATHAADWSNVVLVGLALLAARGGGGLALTWAVVPVALLSLLPHKEARYVIATIPFWSLAAARGLWLAIDDLVAAPAASRAPMKAAGLVVLLAGGFLYDASRFRFHRSENVVRLGWQLQPSAVAGLAADQLWRFGGRLYMPPGTPLIDLDPGLASNEAIATAAFCRPEIAWVALRDDRVTAERSRALAACGLTRVAAGDEAGYAVFRKPS
jgi:hypothetical protein